MNPLLLRLWAWTPALLRALAALVSLSVLRAAYNGFLIRRKFRKMKAQGVPVLAHSWIWGHLAIVYEWSRQGPKDMHIFNLMHYVKDNHDRFFPGLTAAPPVIYLDIWPVNLPMMVVIDPDLSGQFTQDAALPKHEMVKDVMMPLTEGRDLNTLNGDDWKFWRTKFNPGFSTRNMLALLPDILEEVAVFGQTLSKQAAGDNAWGPVFQLEEHTTNLTLDVIGRAILDLRMNEQSGRPSAMRKALERQGNMMDLGVNPFRFLQPFNVVRRWELYRNNSIMWNYFMSHVKQRKSGSSTVQRKTIIDLALASLEKEQGDAISGVKPASGSASFMDGLFQNFKIFLFAGYDTTATTICWVFHYLERNAACLERLRAEHDTILGPDPDTAEAAIRERPVLVNSLSYTTAVVKETLRLSPAAMTIRQGHEGFSMTKPGFPPFPTDGFMIWDGVPAVHRNPESWPRPNDFVPERFLVGEEDPLYPAKNAWRPFQQPPRSCIGQELAMLEIKLALALVARKFDIRTAWEEWDRCNGSSGPPSCVNGERLYMVGTTTVHPKDGMPVQIRKR